MRDYPRKTFEERIHQDVMNLLFSYSVKDDFEAEKRGYKFYGAGYDNEGNEVHVFELKELAKFS